MSDRATELAVIVITLSHVLLYAMAWWWAARSRHIGFLVLIVPAAVAWSLAGYRPALVPPHGPNRFGPPKGALRTPGRPGPATGSAPLFRRPLRAPFSTRCNLWLKRARSL